jgi:hypothetical protein
MSTTAAYFKAIIAFYTGLSRLTLTTRDYHKWLDMTELCRLVYVCGEDVNVQDNCNGYTPLHRLVIIITVTV